MEKTHKPTWHFSSCASRFQQSSRYRDIQPEDFSIPFGVTLVPGADDELTKSERAAKRRRIEGLAKGFLDGRTLVISSAAANGVDLRAVVEKALKEKNISWDEASRDVHARSIASEVPTASRTQPNTASCIKPSGSNRAQNNASDQHISTTPSAGALARAAKLRPGRQCVSTRSSARRTSITGGQNQPVASMERPGASCRETKLRHLQSDVSVEDSLADELRLSRAESPSRKVKSHSSRSLDLRSYVFDRTNQSELAPVVLEPQTPQSDLHAQSLRHDATEISDDHTERSPDGDESPDIALHMGADVAPSTASEMESTAMSLCTAFQKSSANNRIAMYPAEQRPKLAATTQGLVPVSAVMSQQTGWTTSNAPGSVVSHIQACASETMAPGPGLLEEDSLLETIVHGSYRSPAQSVVAPKSSSSRRVTRQKAQTTQNGLLESFKQAKPGYQSAPLSQGGTTPLIYKKRGRLAKRSLPVYRTTRTELDDQSYAFDSAAPPQTLEPPLQAKSSAKSAHLELPFDDDSFAPARNMALVDEHLNKPLSADGGCYQSTSSLKSALRKEMRASGATIERAEGEPSSSQLGGQRRTAEDTEDLGSEVPAVHHKKLSECRRSTMLWPGTQAMLGQAQHNMFTSPEKMSVTNDNHPGRATSEPAGDFRRACLPQDDGTHLNNLQQYYSPSLPATQALMEQWPGWSTTKKPKAQKRASFAPSPLITKTSLHASRSTRTRTRSSLGVLTAVGDLIRTEPKHSGLRSSTSTAETPEPLITSALRVSMTDSELLADTTIRPAGAAPASTLSTTRSHSITISHNSHSSDINLMDISFAATAARACTRQWNSQQGDMASTVYLSSFQAAQPVSDFGAETTLASIARDLLSTADIAGALSQV